MGRGSIPQRHVQPARDVPFGSSREAVVDESGGVAVDRIVYISGRSNSFPKVSYADATDIDKCSGQLYITRHAADDGARVDILPWKWVVADTTGYTAGDQLFLTTSGSYAASPPDGAVLSIVVGRAVDSDTSGRINLEPQGANGPAIGSSQWVKFDVGYAEDTGSGTEVTLFTVPTGQAYLVEDALVEVTTTWDGGSASLTLGTDGTTVNDPDGLIPAASIDLTTAAYDGIGVEEKGAHLYLATTGDLDGEVPYVGPLVVPAADSITATVTKGTTPSQGAASFWVKMTRIK